MAVLSIMLNGCKQLFQPTRADLTGMNHFSEGTYKLDISVDVIDGDFTMYYDSVVTATVAKAAWNGEATVYYLNAYFKQVCQSYCDADASCKKWREAWTKSDSTLPIEQILQWQSRIEEGKGYYHKKPAAAAEYGDALADIDGKVYAIDLHDVSLDWSALCDVNLDSLFGGNDRLGSFSEADVTLLYGTEDLLLKAILADYQDTDKWLSIAILISPTDEHLDFKVSDFVLQDGLLTEEWDMAMLEE